MTQVSGGVLERVAEARSGETGATSLVGNVLQLLPTTARSTPRRPRDVLGPFNARIAFAHGVGVGGWTQLSLYREGAWRFTGHLYAQGAASYDVTVAWAVRNRGTGDVFVLSHSGLVGRSSGCGAGEDHWADAGRCSMIADGWAGLFEGGYAWSLRAGANVDGDAIVSAARAPLGPAAATIELV